MMCDDIIGLVGQEVLNIREVSMNKTKYESVVWVMDHMICQANHYHYGPGSCQDGDCNAPLCVTCFGANDYQGSYVPSFISDFKDCLHEYWYDPPKWRSNLDACGGWSMGWGGLGPGYRIRNQL